jgi:hypothetical protein
MEGLPVLQTVLSVEIITVWNKDIKKCEPSFGYLYSFIVHIKKGTVLESPPSFLVTRLKQQQYIHKGYALYLNNYCKVFKVM